MIVWQDFLFHTICISVLDVYADLVESLAINAFSLHSTGIQFSLSICANKELVEYRAQARVSENELLECHFRWRLPSWSHLFHEYQLQRIYLQVSAVVWTGAGRIRVLAGSPCNLVHR